jgi:hypothetical protein
MGIRTCQHVVTPIALLIGVVCPAVVAGAGARLYTGTIQIRVDYGGGSVYSIPIGAKISYPRMNNLPAGDAATTIANSPIGVGIPANQMMLVTSLSTYSPPASWGLAWIASTFDGHNGTGSFAPGGAPGSATSAPVTSAAGSGFKVSFSGTPTQFGGTMRLLAVGTEAYRWPDFANWNVARDFGAVGGDLGGKRAVTGTVFHGTAGLRTFFSQTVWGFPWTTGTVMATAPPGEIQPSTEAARITAMGSDMRTPQGDGKLQLVTPFLVRQRDRQSGSMLYNGAGVAIVSLDFVPEPSAIAQLVAGLSALAALYRVSMREPKS